MKTRITVGVDAHAIARRQTGNEVYVRSLIARYPALAPEADFVAYTCRAEADPWIPEGVKRQRVSANPFVRLGYQLGQQAQQDGLDLLHVQYTSPLGCTAPTVVTIHDVSYLERPEFLPWSRARQLRWSVRRSVRRAAKIVTISEFSRQAIARAYGLDPDAIAVTPLAAQERFRPMNRDAARRQTAERLGFDAPFVLNVGDLHPRKNQIGLIRAFADLLAARPELPHRLVICGKRTWFAPRVEEAVHAVGLRDRVVLTDFVDDEFLPVLYNAAELFVFPSFYEGFGLPAIEAMACGRPVVCSDATALPEVVDGAALLFRPDSVEEQARAIRDILIDPELAQRMERMSLQRARFFDWRETARRTLDVYEEVADARLVRRTVERKELAVR